MSPEDRRLLRAISKDIGVIKEQIINLRIRVAVVSATVALLVTLVTGWIVNALPIKPPSTAEPALHSAR